MFLSFPGDHLETLKHTYRGIRGGMERAQVLPFLGPSERPEIQKPLDKLHFSYCPRADNEKSSPDHMGRSSPSEQGGRFNQCYFTSSPQHPFKGDRVSKAGSRVLWALKPRSPLPTPATHHRIALFPPSGRKVGRTMLRTVTALGGFL